MAFKSGTTLENAKTVITNSGSLSHGGFREPSSELLNENEIKITPSDGAANDYFGRSVSIGSGRIVVGSWLDDDNATSAGSAYIFDLDGTQLAKIIASDGDDYDFFGSEVSIGSGRIVAGAENDDDNGSESGSAYIFDLNGNQLAKIKPSDGAANDRFGRSVAVGSGKIVVGAYQDDDNGSDSGSAYIFDLDGTQLAKITASDGASGDAFGYSVAVGSGRIVVGAYTYGIVGSAYIFDLYGTQLAKITASDGASGNAFGISVAIGSGRIVVGASGDDANSGSAYIFDRDGNQITKITASDGDVNDYFGTSVAVGSGRIVVGSLGDSDNGSQSGSSYIFDLDGNQLAKIKSADNDIGDYFGNSVAAGSGKIVVGAMRDNNDNGSYSGSAYIFDLGENYDSYIENIVCNK